MNRTDAPTPGTLYLLPAPIAERALETIPQITLDTARRLSLFVVENERSARRFLSLFMDNAAVDAAQFLILDEHTPINEVASLLTPTLGGQDMGLLSEAGCPCVADPGGSLVAHAHRSGVRVVPLPGPSSIMLALMASGLNGQAFAFNGYLPQDPSERRRALLNLERESATTGRTELFIETPYRNQAMLGDVLAALAPDTLVSVAMSLTDASENVRTMTVQAWRSARVTLAKQPTVFAIGAKTVRVASDPGTRVQKHSRT